MKKTTWILFTILPAILMAHPGHGVVESFNLIHYIYSPEHFLPVVTAIALGFIYWKRKNLAERN